MRNYFPDSVSRTCECQGQRAAQPSRPDKRDFRLSCDRGSIAGVFSLEQNGAPESGPRHVRGRPRLHQILLYIVCMPKSPRGAVKARVLSSREVYRGPVFWVTSDEIIEPAGVRVRRDIVRHSGSVVILAVDETGQEPSILLERQYRHAAEQFLWELPAGRIDPGESELTAAKRELLEETGYTAARWKRVLKFFVTPGFVAESMSVYLARGLRQGKAQPEEDEVIQLRFLPINQAVNWVLSGTIRDAKTMASILWLKQSRIGPKAAQKARSK